MDRVHNQCVGFTGKNYTTLEFQFETYLRGKDLWHHIDGSPVCYCCERERIAGHFECDLGCPRCSNSLLDSWLYGTSDSSSSSTLQDCQRNLAILPQCLLPRSLRLQLSIGIRYFSSVSRIAVHSGLLLPVHESLG